MAVDFITHTQIVDEIISIVRDTAVKGLAIETFLQAEYGLTLKVYDSPDAYKLPGEEDAPYLSIYRNKHSLGEAVSTWDYELELEAGVLDDTLDTGTSNVVLQNGVRNIENLMYLIYDAVRTHIPCNADVDRSELVIDETNHPLYLGYLKINISIPQVIGSVIGI